MDASDKRIKRAIEFDPINYVEKIEGGAVGENGRTTARALATHLSHSKEKEEILKSEGDTTLSMETEAYKEKVEEIGFEKIISEPFESPLSDVEETAFVYWLDGMLLFWDTFDGVRNSASIYSSAIVSENRDTYLPRKFGGSFQKIDGDVIWAGKFDAREAIKYKVSRLLEWSEQVLSQWRVHPSTVFLAHSGEWKSDKDPGKSQEERMSRLPDWLQDCMIAEDLHEDGRGNLYKDDE
jgi:hypothetical protein